MKRKIQLLIAVFMALPMLSMGNPINGKWDYEKTKTIKKEFDVNQIRGLKGGICTWSGKCIRTPLQILKKRLRSTLIT